MAALSALESGTLFALWGGWYVPARCVCPTPAVRLLIRQRYAVLGRTTWLRPSTSLALASGEETRSSTLPGLRGVKGMMPELQPVMDKVMEEEVLLTEVQNELVSAAKERADMEESLLQLCRVDLAGLNVALTMILRRVAWLRDQKDIQSVLRGFLSKVEHAAFENDTLLRRVKMELQRSRS